MPKERQFILDGSPCEDNFYQDGPETVAEARKVGRQRCPYFSKCAGGLLRNGYQCAMYFGVEIARNALKGGHSVAIEMLDFRREMSTGMKQMARKGIIWSPDRKIFEFITNFEEGIKKMEQFAGMVLEEGAEPKLETRTKGDTSRSFEQLVVEATGKDGVVDLAKIEAMSEGRQHDVTSGPCKCGAWH